MCGRLIELLIKHDMEMMGDDEKVQFHGHLRGCKACRARLVRIREWFSPHAGAECGQCERILSPATPGAALEAAVPLTTSGLHHCTA
jgi:hypothetical protein